MVSEFAVRNSDAGSWGICGQGSPPSPGRRRPRHRHRHGGAGAGAGGVPAVYLDAVPASVLPHDAAAVAYDTIVRFMRLGLRTILMLALVVAAGAFLTGGSVTAVRTRQGLAGAIAWLQGSAEHAGLRTRPVGVWVGGNKRGPAHRRRHPGLPGPGVLGPAHRQGRPRPHPGPPGRPGPDRVPRTAGPPAGGGRGRPAMTQVRQCTTTWRARMATRIAR